MESAAGAPGRPQYGAAPWVLAAIVIERRETCEGWGFLAADAFSSGMDQRQRGSLAPRSVDFFKHEAKRRVPYQRMIRALVDRYAEREKGKGARARRR